MKDEMPDELWIPPSLLGTFICFPEDKPTRYVRIDLAAAAQGEINIDPNQLAVIVNHLEKDGKTPNWMVVVLHSLHEQLCKQYDAALSRLPAKDEGAIEAALHALPLMTLGAHEDTIRSVLEAALQGRGHG